jgi:hypothetical protein
MPVIPAAAGRVSSADSGVEHVLIQTKADIMKYTAGGAQPPSAEERSTGELVKLRPRSLPATWHSGSGEDNDQAGG